MDAPEVISVPQRPRRLSRLAATAHDLRSDARDGDHRGGSARRRSTSARASTAARWRSPTRLPRCAALSLIVVWDAGARFEPWVLLAMPVVILVAQGRRPLRARRARPQEDDARRGARAAADRGPVRADRLPRPERVRARGDDADAGRRAVAGQLRRDAVPRPRRRPRRPPAIAERRALPRRRRRRRDPHGARQARRRAASRPRSSRACRSTRCAPQRRRRALPRGSSATTTCTA